MKKIIALLLLVSFAAGRLAAQPKDETVVLENTLGAVVTVGVFETDIAKKSLGFRGQQSDMAYSKLLDMSGASGSGSGFIIKYNGIPYIITNAHVVEQASDANGSISVYTIDRTKYNAKVVGGDSFYDIAVLSLDRPLGKEASFVNFRSVPARIGEKVYAIGNPLGEYPYTVTDGIVSAKNRIRGGLTGKFGFIQSTATVIWGNSGGPLVDASGQVLGINSQIAFARQGNQSIWQPQINFALEANLATRLIEDIINNNGIVKRVFLGAEIVQRKNPYQPGTRDYSTYARSYPADAYPKIGNVAANSPAQALKNYAGYSILAVNNEPTRNLEEVLGEFEKAVPGQKLTLQLERNGTKQTVTVTPPALTKAYSSEMGKAFLQNNGIEFTQVQNAIYVRVNNGAPQQQDQQMQKQREGATGFITVSKKTAVSTGDVTGSEWQLLGIGILEDDYEALWRINDIADVGTAARLTGLSGVVDIVLFRRGGDPAREENYIKKRVSLSGDNNIFQQSLFY